MSDETNRETGTSGQPDLRSILDDVAAGRISAEQASRLLAQAGGTAPGAPGGNGPESSDASGEPPHAGARDAGIGAAGTAGQRESEQPGTSGPPSRLRIRAVGRRVRIVGEPFLSAVAVEGPHVMKTDGDTLSVISEGEFTPSLDNFTLRTPSLRDLQERFVDLTRELVIRANPRLDLEIEITAGSITAERAPAIRHLRITAGSAKLRDVAGPLDLLVQGGSATVEGPIAHGQSKLRVESGSLNLNLLHGSDVTVTQDAQLGRVTWNGDGAGSEPHVVGAGTAAMRIEALMANVTIREA